MPVNEAKTIWSVGRSHHRDRDGAAIDAGLAADAGSTLGAGFWGGFNSVDTSDARSIRTFSRRKLILSANSGKAKRFPAPQAAPPKRWQMLRVCNRFGRPRQTPPSRCFFLKQVALITYSSSPPSRVRLARPLSILPGVPGKPPGLSPFPTTAGTGALGVAAAELQPGVPIFFGSATSPIPGGGRVSAVNPLRAASVSEWL